MVVAYVLLLFKVLNVSLTKTHRLQMHVCTTGGTQRAERVKQIVSQKISFTISHLVLIVHKIWYRKQDKKSFHLHGSGQFWRHCGTVAISRFSRKFIGAPQTNVLT